MKEHVSRTIPPVVTRIKGVDFINVPLAHYLNLTGRPEVVEPGRGEAAPVSAAQLAARVCSPIYLDHEVADFLYAEVGRLTIDQARAACIERFGVGRTPSKSAINRYWMRLRRKGDADRKGKA